MPEEVLTNIPEEVVDILEETVTFVESRTCSVLINLLDLDYTLDTNIHEMYTTAENALCPHMMIHMSYNARMHKMYFEFTFDRFMMNYLRSIGIYTEFRNKLSKKLTNEYKDYIGLNNRLFVVRPRMYCPKEYTITNLITMGTVGTWKSLEGKDEFLNDTIETELAFTQYKVDTAPRETAYFARLEAFAAKIHEINIKYKYGVFTFAEAYEAYKDYYNMQFQDIYTEAGETKSYKPLYDFYQKYYYIDFLNLIPDDEEE